MDIVGKRNFYFLVSLILILPGIISLLLFGLKLSIDFTGGTRIEYRITDKTKPTNLDIEQLIKQEEIEVGSVQSSGKNSFIIRTKPLNPDQTKKIQETLDKKYQDVKQLSTETIGPTIGEETALNAFKSIALASILIVIYIAWSFRKVPKPASSWRFGVCAVGALLHDVLVVVGIFSILGKLYHVEVDSLFVTAILTVIGFSVHDTIVVFDRIRENLIRAGTSTSFERITNDSILQTLGRSLNTSLTVILTLFTMLLFGGETIRWFVVALLIGIASGTYSSIFNAAPLLVVWEEWSRKRALKNKKG